MNIDKHLLSTNCMACQDNNENRDCAKKKRKVIASMGKVVLVSW